jgi:phage shock protein A
VADPVNDWLARFQAAQPADHALRLTNLEAQLTTLTVALAASIQKITTMEEHMSQTDDAVAELNDRHQRPGRAHRRDPGERGQPRRQHRQ